MFKVINAQSISAFTAAALMACLAVFLTSIVPEAKAEAQVKGALDHARAKGDRLSILVKGAACSSRSWPYYEQSCQFDLRRPADEARTVRIIALR